LRESNLKIVDKIVINADTGYVGISKLHKNSVLPKKRVKKIRFPQRIRKITESCPLRESQ